MTVISCSNKNTETPTQSSLPGLEILTCQGPINLSGQVWSFTWQSCWGHPEQAYHADTATQASALFLSIAGGLPGISDSHQAVFKCLYFQEKQKRNHLGLISVFPQREF